MKLLNYLFGSRKPKRLKELIQEVKFEEALVPIDMPNVGTYKPGSRTKYGKPIST